MTTNPLTQQIAADNMAVWLETEALKLGTDNQRERWRAHLLPDDEILQLARAELFKGFANLVRWNSSDIRRELTQELRGKRHEHGCANDRPELEVADVSELTAEQWDRYKNLGAITDALNMHPWMFRQKASATISSFTHWATCLGCGAEVCASGAKVSVPWAGRTLVREFRL